MLCKLRATGANFGRFYCCTKFDVIHIKGFFNISFRSLKIFLCIVLRNGLEDISCPSTLLPPRLDRRVLVVAPMTFMMTQQRTRTICNSTLIAIFAHLEIIERANQIARMRNFIISLNKGNSSDRGYNCEAKLQCEHF